MIKMKKLAAIAAAAVMAVSTMAVSANAYNYQKVTKSSPYGTFTGETEIGPYGTGKEVTATTSLPLGSIAPEVGVNLVIRSLSGSILYADSTFVPNTYFAGLIARSGSSDSVSVNSVFYVGPGNGTYITEKITGLVG